MFEMLLFARVGVERMSLHAKSVLLKLLQIFYKGMERNHDYVIVVTGKEGIGKSNLFLNILDSWYKQVLGKDIPKGRYGVGIKEFIQAIDTGKKFDFCGLDEGGDELDRDSYRDLLNQTLYKTYTIIRGEIFFTVICLPSFFDLNPRFRQRRVRGIFYVYRRQDNKCKKCSKLFAGNVCSCGSTDYVAGYIQWRYFTRHRINQIIARNKNRPIPSLNVGVQGIEGITYEYKGELLSEYTQMKVKKMRDARTNLKNLMLEANESSSNKCIYCKSRDIRYVRKSELFYCKKCGKEWVKEPSNDVKPTKTPKKTGKNEVLGG